MVYWYVMTRIGAWDTLAEEWVVESQEVAGQGCQGGKGELMTHGCNSLLVGRT